MPELFEGAPATTKVAAVGVVLVVLGLVWVVFAASGRLAEADARAEADHAQATREAWWPFITDARVSSPVEGLGIVADVPRLPGLIPVRFDNDPDVVRFMFPDHIVPVTPSDEELLRRVEDRGREVWRATHERPAPSASTPPPPPTPNGVRPAPSCSCIDHNPAECRRFGPCCGSCPTLPV